MRDLQETIHIDYKSLTVTRMFIALSWVAQVQQKEKNSMATYEKLSHTTWKCKYYVVFISKYHRKGLFGAIRKGALSKQTLSEIKC